ITPDGIAYTDFPEDSSSSHTVARIDLTDAKVSPGSFELPDAAIRQYGRYLLARSSKFTDSFFKTRRSKEYREKAVAFDPYMNEPSYVGFEDITFRLMDSTTGKTLWTREFKNEAPQYIFDTAHDVLTFYWRANQKAAKKIIDDDPKLKQASKREEFSDYDIVVEIGRAHV